MAAVVQDDVGGVTAALVAVDFSDQVLRDRIGGGFLPVGGHGVPGDGNEAELAGEFEHVGAARAEGRAEISNGFSGDVGEDVAGAGELVEHVGGASAGEIGVRPGVVADEVPGIEDAAGEVGLGLGEFANHEERGVNAVLGEDVEEARRTCGVGAVVEGEGKLAGGARCDEGAAKNLRGGPAGGIGKACRGEAEAAGRGDGCVNSRS